MNATKSKVRHIPLTKLVPHPDNPNRMSRAAFSKLMRHIKRTGRYEPLVVRPHPDRDGHFQIINGHHRCQALDKLSHQTAQVVVWDIDDEQTDLLLTTLNRLGGRDMLDKKLALLRRLNRRMTTRKLARLVPQTRGQLERLIARKPPSQARAKSAEAFAVPLVFFVSKDQQRTIEAALSEAPAASDATTRARRRAAALTNLAERTLEESVGGSLKAQRSEALGMVTGPGACQRTGPSAIPKSCGLEAATQPAVATQSIQRSDSQGREVL
ncbi:MAG: ParB N-terminal domain-containing protein [bacterium]|nr:ParB N-terminal domain-containing protein [bacterium]